MIREVDSDLFGLNVDALAHGCNTQGIMNAGIAREFRKRYPAMFDEYRDYCNTGLFKPSEVHFYRNPEGRPHIINIATQLNIGDSARLEYAEGGFGNIRENYKRWKINSLGMPRIGCGLGGLDWNDVRGLVENVFGTLDLEVLIASR